MDKSNTLKYSKDKMVYDIDLQIKYRKNFYKTSEIQDSG